jgi:polysaccharide biosynthesis/export protein
LRILQLRILRHAVLNFFRFFFYQRSVMRFGKLRFARSVRSLVIVAGAVLSIAIDAGSQQAPSTADAPVMPVSAAAQSTSQPPTSPNSSSPGTEAPTDTKIQVYPTTVKLGAGDLLEIGVYNAPELSTKARIGSSGDLYLPLVDYVHVAGLTIDEAQALIAKRLESGGFVRNPHVTIFLDESASQGVTVLGEVVRPGIYPLLGDRKLYDLISAAGGFSQAAGRKVSIIRENNPTPITVNLPRNLAEDMQDNIEILPGDTITVPKAPIIYVVGEVGHPAGLLVDNGSLSVLQALALAGGTSHTAKLGGTCIIRKGPAGMTETRLPLKKMLEAKAPDMPLQADDILFVPLSGVKVAAAQGMSSAISAAAGLAIIAVH